MLDFRPRAFEQSESMDIQTWDSDMTNLGFDDYTYYIEPSDKTEKNWEDVPDTIKDTFDKLGIPEAEEEFLAGVTTQYDSEAVYHNMLEETESEGVIFLDTDTVLKQHPDLFQKYFGGLVPYTDNKFAALNGCVWNGGSFIYVPKGIKLEKSLQSYLHINTERTGQFEHTLIIVDEGANMYYVEGCTAPAYSKDPLHAAVVGIFVYKNARYRRSTVQNWSGNITDLVTKCARVFENGSME